MEPIINNKARELALQAIAMINESHAEELARDKQGKSWYKEYKKLVLKLFSNK